MLDNSDKIQVDKYMEFLIVSQKDQSKVSLVMNSEINLIAVKKVYKGKISNIYKKIKNIDNIHLPKVYFIHEEEDQFKVIEEYIEGITLQELLLSPEAIDEAKLIDILLQLCEPLNVLHNLSSPIIHRDIKPSNIIISKSGVLKLIDFDASREYKLDATKDTISLGTIEYAAPEQFGYSQTDVRSDIYAIGMLITDFLQKANKDNYSYKHISELKKIVDKCAMFDPNQRYQNIKELQEAINRVKKTKRARNIVFGIPILLCLTAIVLLITNWTKDMQMFLKADTRSDQNYLETDINNTTANKENKLNSEINKTLPKDANLNDDKEINNEKFILKTDEDIINEYMIITPNTNTENTNGENSSNEIRNEGNSHGEKKDSEHVNILEADKDVETSIDKTISPDNGDIGLDRKMEPDDTSEIEESSVDIRSLEPTLSNPNTDYYKNPKYSEDIKIYIHYNKASKVEYLNLLNYGHINPSNYSIDGNIITIKKEYLCTLANDYYNLYIGFDKGQPINAQFEVHAENEEFIYGKYQLSHYYREFYTRSPENLTYIVYNTANTRIKALWNGLSKIDASSYNIEENGYVVNLYKSYLNGLTEGSKIMLRLEFDNGDMQETNIKIMREPIISPSFLSAENTFIKSSPDEVAFKIIWNDANDLLAIHSSTPETPALLKGDYELEDDIFTINKEFLLKHNSGTYKWVFVFDMDLNNNLTIHIRD